MKHIFIFRGGLGNQMFQYALLLALRHRGFIVSIDTTTYDYFQMHNGYELNRVFGITDDVKIRKGFGRFLQRFILRYKICGLVSEDIMEYTSDILKAPKKYITGWWQDARYFADIENEIRKVYQFEILDNNIRKLANEIHTHNSVSLHLRRGDYSTFGMQMIADAYYENAVKYVTGRVQNPMFYIFSDDKDEATKLAERLGIRYDVVTENTGDRSYYDMYLMSQCSHNIIANSSFSWWGAWLNANPDKIVICPKIWEPKTPNLAIQLPEWIKI